jgi:hypothetical protein
MNVIYSRYSETVYQYLAYKGILVFSSILKILSLLREQQQQQQQQNYI